MVQFNFFSNSKFSFYNSEPPMKIGVQW